MSNVQIPMSNEGFGPVYEILLKYNGNEKNSRAFLKSMMETSFNNDCVRCIRYLALRFTIIRPVVRLSGHALT